MWSASTGSLHATSMVPAETLPTPAEPTFVVHADFNKDGFEDLAVGNSSTNVVTVYWNRDLLAFDRQDVPTPFPPSHGFAGDLDGDGFDDLVVYNPGAAGQLASVLNNGAGGWNSVKIANTERLVASADAVDVDQDGKKDVVALDGSGTIFLLQNVPPGGLEEVASFAVAPAVQ